MCEVTRYEPYVEPRDGAPYAGLEESEDGDWVAYVPLKVTEFDYCVDSIAVKVKEVEDE